LFDRSDSCRIAVRHIPLRQATDLVAFIFSRGFFSNGTTMESTDGRTIFNLLQQGKLIDGHVEQYLKVVISGDLDIYNLPGVRFKRVGDGTLDFIVQAHHHEILARYGHLVKKEQHRRRVVGRFVFYQIEQYLRVGASGTPIGVVEIDGEGKVDVDDTAITPWPDGSGSIVHTSLLRSSLVAMLQRSLEE